MDAGLALVDRLYTAMNIDDEWAIRSGRGFTWWAGPLAQHVWADPPADDLGMEIGRVHARTEMLSQFPSTSEPRVAATANYATMSGPLVGEGRVDLAATVFVHDQTLDYWQRPFIFAALTQVAAAHIQAETLADFASAKVAVSGHPISGFRSELDEMLEIIPQVIAPEGAKPSFFIGTGFEDVERQLGRQLSLLTTADESGLTSEFPFGDETAMFQMFADVPNPQLGNGVLTILTLPTRHEEEEVLLKALHLNRRECTSMTRAQFLGSWCKHPSMPGALSFVSFLPNVCYFPGFQNLHSPAEIHSALRTHPVVIYAGQSRPNPYYEAPAILRNEPRLNGSDTNADRVAAMLKTLRKPS